MQKRLVSLFICLCLLITMFPVKASAATDNSLSATAKSTNKKTEYSFSDVKKSDSYYDAVQYTREKGYFLGNSKDKFNPKQTMTRSMFITVLGRMAGVDTTKYKGKTTYSDVPANASYAPYLNWAKKHGITDGIGGGKFAPNSMINRQQMAVMLTRYFTNFGVKYKTGIQITTAPADIDRVSAFAKSSVLKMWKSGMMTGDGVNFKPLSKVTRADTAMISMHIDKAVQTWYKEPGVPKGATPTVKPTATPTVTTSGSGSSSNNTLYFNVTLTAGKETITKLYPAGTLLNTLPVPAQEGGTVFLGWYYDQDLSKMVASTDVLGSNVKLYAKFTEAVSLAEEGELNFVTKQDAVANLKININSESAPVLGTDFIFRNITDPSVTNGTQGIEQETLSVTGSTGSYTVASAKGSFTPGHTYQIELLNEEITFEGEGDKIRFYNFIVQKDEVMNLSLNDGVKYISASKLSETDRSNVLDYAGLYQAVTDAQGQTTYTPINGYGSFAYSGGGIVEGDTVAIYTGDKPDVRSVEDSGEVAYLEITGIDGTTYYYQSADSEDVLFTPDILPIDLDTGDGVTEGNQLATSGTGTITIISSKLNYNDEKYADMGLGVDTVVQPGDYLGFFTGDFGTSANPQGYGEIIGITSDGSHTRITYKIVSEEDVLSAMELYSESELTDEEIEGAYDEQLIREAVESQLMSSGFIQEAGEYLAGLAVQTDEVKEIFGSGDDIRLSDYTVTYRDGTPVSEDDLALMGNIVNKEGGVKTSVSVSPRLSHYEGKKGVRVEVAVTYKFDIQKSGSNKKVEVELTAFFEQEVVFGFSVSGGAVWKWKWIFPYIADYRMTGNIDLGTYTGVGITATAKLAQEKEAWGMPWPNSAKEAQATKKIFSLSQSIKEMMDDIETVLPEAEASSSGGLAEKYAEFMKDANEKWTDLFVVNLIDLRGAVDPLHILAYGIQVDFVVSANLNVAIGMTFQYENSKRHSFTMSLKNKNADSETIDLSTNGYQFDFYVMGALGIRAGVRAKALVGLFSTKLDGIGLQIEAGAYARLWGYFYYSLTNYKINGKWEKNSSSSGALLVEIGAYLDVKFVAEVLNGKYSYAPTIFAKEWPFWSAGQRENVYDFAYSSDPTYTIQNVTTYTLPSTVFDMKWMDLKNGDIGTDSKPKTKNFDDKVAVNTDDEKYFAVELSNPAFTYNPVNNQITVSKASGNSQLECEIKLTWKGAPLAFSTESLTRTIKLKWSDLINGKTMIFETNGGSPVDMICKLAGANIATLKPANPTKAGYTFAGWYTNSNFTGTAYTIPNTMPNENLKLYAKWTPNVAPYTVEHYQQGLDGRYVLEESQSMSGTSTQNSNATAKSYPGFTPKAIEQKIIQPDGNTVVQIYYERNSYTITFNYGMEADNRSIVVKYPMGAAIEASIPTLLGYTFQHWNSTVPTVMPANNLTFTAVWSANQDTKYSVEHYQESLTDGRYVLMETEFKVGTSNATVTPEVKNYTGFTAPSQQTVTIKGDGTAVVKYYYTRNSYTMTYELENNENNIVQVYKFGANVIMQSAPSKEGYTFAGWKEDGAESSIPAIMPARDVTLKAQWTVKQYTISFDSNGGSALKAITQAYNTEVTAPEAPTKEGYTFAGWQLNGNDYVFTTMPAKDITLTAIWTAKSDIAYKVEHYKETLNGTYSSTPSETENLSGSTGATVYAAAKNYDGFTYNSSEGGTVSSGIVKADGSLVLKIYYTRNNYTLTYVLGNDNDVEKVYRFEEDVEQLTPSRDGFIFAGWKENGVKVEIPSTMPARDVTLAAAWNAKQYTIEFDSNGGSTVADIIREYGASVTAPIAPTRTGYTFVGWLLNNEIYTFTTMPSENIKLIAAWTVNQYTIRFNSNGGSAVADIKQVYDTIVTAPTAPTKAGYNFAGWQLNGNDYIFTTMPAEDITLTATWTAKNDITYKVEHFREINDGIYPTTPNETENLSGSTGETVYATAKSYSGFTYNPNAANTVAAGTVTADGSLVLKIYYNRNSYTLTYILGNDYDDVENVYMFEDEVEYFTPSRVGYTFVGWKEDGETVEIPNNMPARDVTLVAEWKANQYTISFNSNGGSEVEDITKDYGTAVTAPTTPTRTGFTFAGWKLNNEIYTFTTMPAENITLIAVWISNSNIPYKVEHYKENLDGTYSSTPSETENLSGTTGDTVYANVKTYIGFTYDASVNETISSGTISADGSLVLKLYYIRNSYTVTWYDDNNNVDTSGATTGLVKFGATITKPSNDPSKTGYTFNQWAGYSTNMTMPAQETTFTALWTINSYKITFDSDGGSTVAAITKAYGSTVTAPTAPTKAGYFFKGWQLDGVDYTFSTMPAMNITLVAVWTQPPTFTVSFDANGGTVNTDSKSVVYGAYYGELPIPSKSGLVFTGWYTAVSGGYKVTSYSYVNLTDNHTLYARWAVIHPDLELYVAGIKVTEENMNDILGDGKVWFDPSTTVSYSSGSVYEAGTLYLNNATINGSYGENYANAAIYCNLYLTIVNTGDSSITNTFNEETSVSNVCGIFAWGGVSITGAGTLTVTSGTGGSISNCGIRYGGSGDYFTINGPTVKTFGGVAGSNGKSYGVRVEGEYLYLVILKNGTLETHGYDCAAYTGPAHELVNYFIYDGTTVYSTIFTTITVSDNYDGSQEITIPQDNTYRNYKYIIVTNP